VGDGLVVERAEVRAQVALEPHGPRGLEGLHRCGARWRDQESRTGRGFVVWTLEDGRGKRRRGWKTAWGFVWAGGGKAVEDLLVLGATTAGFFGYCV
jgi:hypothetical protein